MAEKTLNTRILLKYDTYSNWTTKNPVLKAGEVAIATIASGSTQEVNSVTAPQVLIKVGDGTSTYTALPFVSAKAADVYSWAKAENKPTYQASEITGISDYIAEYVETEMGISVDTDTQYQIVKVDAYNYKLQSKGKGDAAWADVANGAIVIPKYDDTALAGRVTSLEGLVGNTAVATQIANAIAALDLANTYAAKVHKHTASDVTDFATEVAKVKVANATNADAATKATKDGNGRDIADTYATKVEDATNGHFASLDADGNLKDSGVSLSPSDVESIANWVDWNGEGQMPVSEETFEALEGKVTTLIGNDANKSVRTIANEELAAQLIADGAKESLDTLAEIAAWIQEHPDDAAAMNEAITAIQAQLTGIAAGNGTVKKYVDDAITALKIGDYAKAADLTALAARVTAAEGAITKLNGDEDTAGSVDNKIATALGDAMGDLASIAWTGNVNDLEQTSGDVLIFNCGNATF